MVLIDGEAHYSCSREIGSLVGKSIETIESLGTVEKLHPLQQAFIDEQAGQCGYCLSGIIVEAKALLDKNPNPTRDDIITALDTHLCRCGTHQRIVRAVERAAEVMRGAR
jgi:nicotinate dehydrogenase subunit A